jgi:hypothetical protein
MLAITVRKGYLCERPRPCFSDIIASVITNNNNTVAYN